MNASRGGNCACERTLTHHRHHTIIHIIARAPCVLYYIIVCVRTYSVVSVRTYLHLQSERRYANLAIWAFESFNTFPQLKYGEVYSEDLCVGLAPEDKDVLCCVVLCCVSDASSEARKAILSAIN